MVAAAADGAADLSSAAIISLTARSLSNRKLTALLTVLAIALSVMLLLGVERLRAQARASFAHTIAGTDLIVGARSGAIPLLLYSVFRIGDATNTISWDSYKAVAAHPRVAWTAPISLGDSHRGYRVVGTTTAFFEHYRYGRRQALELDRGQRFDGVFEAVIGADVARELRYRVGQTITVAHGVSEVALRAHDDKPFTVVGILRPTGTPVDRSIHVSLAAIEAIHLNWQAGAPVPGLTISPEQVAKFSLQPKEITAVLVGLTSRIATFEVQRFVNDYDREPLLAILPGATLHALWDMLGMVEQVLLAVSVLVLLVSILGMVAILLNSLNERRRELAILRSVGARPADIVMLVVGESLLLALLGIAVGLLLLYLLLLIAQPLLLSHAGLAIDITMPSGHELLLLALVVLAATLAGLIPAYRAYRYSLADGLIIRV